MNTAPRPLRFEDVPDITPRPAHVPVERVVDFDFYNFLKDGEDVHLAWLALRDSSPEIFWTPRNGGHWVVTRAEDIEVVQGDYDRFSFESTLIPPVPRPLPAHPIDLDPPLHSKYRFLISPAFSPAAVASLERKARGLAISIIDGLAPKGECEFMSDFAKNLPIVVFLGMMDLPWEDSDLLLPLADQIVRPSYPGAQHEARHKIAHYLRSWLDKRQAEPGKDLISDLFRAKVDGEPLPYDTVLGMCVLLMSGGLDTVATMLGYAAQCLATNPKQRQLLIEDPELIPNAIEEMLRRYPISQTGRIITRDMDYKGLQFKQGECIQQIGTLVGLDDRKFGDPLKVDFRRLDADQHATFGQLPHKCIGAPLARRELRVFIEEWLKRIPDFTIKPSTHPRHTCGTVNGCAELHLSWDVR